MRRLLCLQLHRAQRAGTHIDIRFESYGNTELYDSKRPVTNEPRGIDNRVLRSFAIPKAKLPEIGEKLLCIPTEDHPWEYKDFDGVIADGYGKGSVELQYSDYVEVSTFTDKKISFEHNGKSYTMFKIPRGWLITQKKEDPLLTKFKAKIRNKGGDQQ